MAVWNRRLAILTLFLAVALVPRAAGAADGGGGDATAVARGELAALRARLERALARTGADDPRRTDLLVDLATVHRLAGRPAAAERVLRRALTLAEGRKPVRPETVVAILEELARLRRARGDPAAAVRLQRRALRWAIRLRGEAHPEVARILARLAQLELARGRGDRALRLARRAGAVAATLPDDDPTRRTVAAVLERIRSERARAATDPAPPPAATAGFAVQLAAVGSPARARSAATRLRTRFAGALAGLDPLPPEPVETEGGRRLWRVRFGPLPDRRTARAVCGAVRAAGGRCRVIPHLSPSPAAGDGGAQSRRPGPSRR